MSKQLSKAALQAVRVPGDESAPTARADLTGIDSPAPEYWEMHQYWEMVDDLYGGTPALRSKGQTYLPRFKKETESDWEARRDRTFCFPGYRRSIKALTGFPFSKPIETRDQSDDIQRWLSNINLEGDTLHSWAARVFEDGIKYGLAHILIDAPDFEGQVLKRDVNNGFRPYLCALRPNQVIGWKWARVQGVPVLTQLRIKQVVRKDKPSSAFEQEFWDRIRVYELDNQSRVWLSVFEAPATIPAFDASGTGTASVQFQGSPIASNQTNIRTHESGWRQVGSRKQIRNITQIPLRTFYTNRRGFMWATPGLIDLAYMNIEHWQSTSDQNNLLHFARVPRIAFFGWDEETPINFDSSIGIKTADTEARVEWVELEGKSISEGRRSIIDIEERMAVEGVRLLKRDTPSRTATEAALHTVENMSELGCHAMSFSDVLQDSLVELAKFAGSSDPVRDAGKVKVFSDFGLSLEETPELTVLFQSYMADAITLKTFLYELQRRGTLDYRLDVMEEVDAVGREKDTKIDELIDQEEEYIPRFAGQDKRISARSKSGATEE